MATGLQGNKMALENLTQQPPEALTGNGDRKLDANISL